ncbi:bone morphogenetic protein 7-like isoform X2 [Physella acuta]|uniref:bone morphogenetic protein 7-like isoform X2 n=1 Tax=Physella acuta TaxID=109671 RepID=UPI0027DCCD8E|nr:bone morphogenetic protein 7-like isoform X2 [Physella acuta]
MREMCVICCVTMVLFPLVSAYTSSFYTDNNLGQSVPIIQVKQKQQDVQQELLELMGLYSKPKSKVNEKNIQSASKFMQDLYKSLKEVDGYDYVGDSHIHINNLVNVSSLGLDPEKVEGSDVIVSFINKDGEVHIRHKKDSTFYFDFTEVSIREHLKGAELRLYKEVSPAFSSGTFSLNLYFIKDAADMEEKILELESTLRVDWAKTGWITLDATSAARNWTLFPHSNRGLLLKVFDSSGKEHEPRDIGIVSRRGPMDKMPFLVGYMDMDTEILSRRARSLRQARWAQNKDDVSYADNPFTPHQGTPRYKSNSSCQRHNLYINFREIGFDNEFLIAPDGYSAFFCEGDCSFPLGIHMNATNHAIVQTLVHLMTPLEAPKPCCAPTKFGPITLLYYDANSSVVLKRFKEMIVKACGCL